jgi:four helix bundle protein
MNQTIPFPEPGEPATRFDCERLDVYRVAVEFQAFAARLSANRRLGATLRNQLDRASVSVVLCIAEGAGRRTARDKAHFFTIARGSASESAAILDLLAARCLLSDPDCRRGRGLLLRIVGMLTRLIARQGTREPH